MVAQTINKSDNGLLDLAVVDFSVSKCLGGGFLGHIRIIEVLSSSRLLKLVIMKRDNKTIEIKIMHSHGWENLV